MFSDACAVCVSLREGTFLTLEAVDPETEDKDASSLLSLSKASLSSLTSALHAMHAESVQRPHMSMPPHILEASSPAPHILSPTDCLLPTGASRLDTVRATGAGAGAGGCGSGCGDGVPPAYRRRRFSSSSSGDGGEKSLKTDEGLPAFPTAAAYHGRAVESVAHTRQKASPTALKSLGVFLRAQAALASIIPCCESHDACCECYDACAQCNAGASATDLGLLLLPFPLWHILLSLLLFRARAFLRGREEVGNVGEACQARGRLLALLQLGDFRPQSLYFELLLPGSAPRHISLPGLYVSES